MQSPFSYQSLYGVEYPFSKATMWRKATSSVLVCGRPVSKRVHKKKSLPKSISAVGPQSAFKANGGDLFSPPVKGISRAIVETGQRSVAVLQTEPRQKSHGEGSATSTWPSSVQPIMHSPEVSHSLGRRALCTTSAGREARGTTRATGREACDANNTIRIAACDTACTSLREAHDTMCTALDSPTAAPRPYASAPFGHPIQKSALLKLPLRTYHGRVAACAIEDIAYGLAHSKYKNVIVMSGAGTSTHSGIPDFRTPGTGLYDNLQQYNIPSPESIFDITYFACNPKPFFALARDLYPGKYAPNLVHYFVRLLQEKLVLLRNYTQNIDGLERLAGVVPDKLVEAHGSFDTASCIRCGTRQDSEEVKSTIQQGHTPRCNLKPCRGLVKPDIVFFGEDLPRRFHSLKSRDFSQCDLLLVMGTSLEVEPFADLVTLVSSKTPRVLVNREVVRPFNPSSKRPNDLVMTGDLVESVRYLVKEAGWIKDLEHLMAAASGRRCASDGGLVGPNCKREEPSPSLCANRGEPVGTLCTKKEEPVGTLCTKREEPVGTLCIKREEPVGRTLCNKREQPVGTLSTKREEPVGTLSTKKEEPSETLSTMLSDMKLSPVNTRCGIPL